MSATAQQTPASAIGPVAAVLAIEPTAEALATGLSEAERIALEAGISHAAEGATVITLAEARGDITGPTLAPAAVAAYYSSQPPALEVKH